MTSNHDHKSHQIVVNKAVVSNMVQGSQMALQYVLPFIILAMSVGNEAAIDTVWNPAWPNRWYATRTADPEPTSGHAAQDSHQIPNLFASLTHSSLSAEGTFEDVQQVHRQQTLAPSPARPHVSGKGKAHAPRRAALPGQRAKGKKANGGEGPAPGPLQPREPYREPQAPSAIGAKEAPAAAPQMPTTRGAPQGLPHKDKDFPLAGPVPGPSYVTGPAMAPLSQETEAPQPASLNTPEVTGPVLTDTGPEPTQHIAPGAAEPMPAPTQSEVGPLVSVEPLVPQAGPPDLLLQPFDLAPAPASVPDPGVPSLAPTLPVQPVFQQDAQPVILASGRQQDAPGFGLMKAVWQLLQSSQPGPLVLPGTGSVAGDSFATLASQAPSGTAISTRGT